jgi:site-specific DNA recombinase
MGVAQPARTRLIRSLELTDDPTGELVRDIQLRATKLAQQQDEKRTELRTLQQAEPVRQSPELLDALPIGTTDLTELPEEILHRLFEAFRLQVFYDKDTHTATCTITIAGESLHAVQQAARKTIKNRQDEGPATVAQLPICAVPPAGFEPAAPALGEQGRSRPLTRTDLLRCQLWLTPFA